MVVDYWFPVDMFELARLLLEIENVMERSPRSKLGVSTGWSSEKNLFDWPDTTWLKHICQSICNSSHEAIKLRTPNDWDVSAWANVLFPGERVAWHNHVKSHKGGVNDWAGIFYFTPGETKFRCESFYGSLGQVIVFPASLDHCVERYKGVRPRITVAFSAKRN